MILKNQIVKNKVQIINGFSVILITKIISLSGTYPIYDARDRHSPRFIKSEHIKLNDRFVIKMQKPLLYCFYYQNYRFSER